MPPSPAPLAAPEQVPGHRHGHTQDHGHAHAHAPGHGHAHAGGPAPASRGGPPSLLMAGVATRLLGVAGLLALLWAAVAWAMGEPA